MAPITGSSTGTSLSKSLTEPLKNEICEIFWPKQKASVRFDLYFKCYNGIREALVAGFPHREIDRLTARTHQDIAAIIKTVQSLLSNGGHCTRPDIRAELSSDPKFAGHEVDSMNNSINVALRVWLTLSIREDKFSPAEENIQWDDGTDLRDFVRGQFPIPDDKYRMTRKNDIILDSHFTAAYMREYCQIKTEWTYNLKQHLTIRSRRGEKTLFIYPLASCLQAHQSCTTIIPHPLIAETLRTLTLLFPSTDRTDAFLNKHHPDLLSEYPFIYNDRNELPATPLADFHIWRHRLELLHNEYMTPGSLWNDRRNRRDWLNFWVGIGAVIILTLVFGVVSSVLAGIGLNYTYQQLLLAQAAASEVTCPPCSTVTAVVFGS